MPYRQCKKSGCTELVRAYGGSGYCQKHSNEYEDKMRDAHKKYDASRGTAAARGYGGKWQKARETFLRNNPLCVHCTADGIITAATVVDHIIPHRGDKSLFWDRSNWQGLCTRCHNIKTAKGE